MAQGWLQIGIFLVVVVALTPPLGIYMARVFESRRVRVTEGWFYRLVRTSPAREQDWKGYAKSVLIFSVLASALVYVIQRVQAHLFLNPDHLQSVPADFFDGA